MNAAELLQRAARDRPRQAALVVGAGGRRERVTSFAELADAASRFAGMLRENGVGPGSGVLMLAPLSAGLYAAMIGTLHAGATATFLDPSAGVGHVRRCCAMRPPNLVVGSVKAWPLRLLVGELRRARWVGVKAAGNAVDVRPRDSTDPAVMTFTSGSTGRPKAAVRSHGVLLAQGDAIRGEFDLRPGEADLTTLPMFVLANLAAGVTSVLPDVDFRRPGSADARPVLAAMERHGCATAAGSPALLGRCAAAGPMPSLRGVFVGGAPVMPGVVSALQMSAANARVVCVYGSTEAEPIASIDAAEVDDADHDERRRGGGLLAGRPVPACDLRVITDRWGTPLGPMPAGEFDALQSTVGEIVVAGPHVLSGYLNGVGDAETKVDVGGRIWHRTGDAGRFDERGRLWLLGRCAARVGHRYPLQVEAAVADDVARSAYVEHRGRRLLLVESGRPANVPPGVDEVVPIDHIPVDRRHNAKIDYPALRKMLARRL